MCYNSNVISLERRKMMINWKVRIKNKAFWIAFIPTLLIFIQVIAVPFGFELNFDELQGQLLAIVDALFALLALLGVVNDPTTKGIGDSKNALTYREPK